MNESDFDYEPGFEDGPDEIPQEKDLSAKGEADEKGDGSLEHPFTKQYIGKAFERQDYEGRSFSFGVCERDDGYEIIVEPIQPGNNRFYALHPDGSITDLAARRPSAEQVEVDEFKAFGAEHWPSEIDKTMSTFSEEDLQDVRHR